MAWITGAPPAGTTGVPFTPTEQPTPVCWIDGAAVFQKTISLGAIATTPLHQVAHGITGIDRVIWFKVGAIQRTGPVEARPIQHVANGGLTAEFLDVILDGTNVVLEAGVDYSAYTGFLTILYTKAAAGNCSGGAGIPFSTTAFDTGVLWIDGTHIWQKTVSVPVGPNGSTITVAHGIGSISRLVELYGCAQRAGPFEAVMLPRTAGSLNQPDNCDLHLTASDIVLSSNADYSAYSGFVTLQYLP